MENKKHKAYIILQKYKQWHKCLQGDWEHHCVQCGAILDNVPVVNYDKNEEMGSGSEFLFIQNGIIYHGDLNSDLDTHRIDRFVPEQIDDED